MDTDDRQRVGADDMPANGDGPISPVADQFSDTDLGNARRMVADHGDDLRHAADLGSWYAWDGRRWAEDLTGEHERRAKTTVDGLLDIARATTDDDRRKRLIRHWNTSSSAPRIRGMIDLARTEPGIPVLSNELDRDRWSLNILNGTLDLVTGQLRPHRRRDFHTKLAPVRFEARAICPTWLRFLGDVFDGDNDLIAFVQRSVGYALTGDVSEEVLWLAHGDGANGKSTFATTVRHLLGDYAIEIDSRLLLASTHDQHPTGIMDLRGMRLVTTREAEHDRPLAEATVKRLVSAEPIRARRMHRDLVQFEPTHKLWFAVNQLPAVVGTDQGIWRRLLRVPFALRFDGDRRDPMMADRLDDELDGILVWALEGCRAWQEDGLQVPETVRAATDAYRADSDHVGRFLNEMCVLGQDRSVTAAALRRTYEAWCRDADAGEPKSPKALGYELTKRGLRRERTGSPKTWRWVGIGLTDEPTLADPIYLSVAPLGRT
jgi:putative DNA primase/helicase